MNLRRRRKGAFVPVSRHDTVRREIAAALEGKTLSVRDISGAVKISEKDVYEHLYHIQKTINKRDYKLIITPAACKKCGFVFRKRNKLKKPGKCPVCRSEAIEEPLFSIQ